MHFSNRDIDRIVQTGSEARIQYWAYDIVAERLEQTGFKRRSEIACEGPITMEGSVYCNKKGDRVVLSTHRFIGPITVIKSIPASSKEAEN
jgi:hypothetical protein